jgi:hypothetical protein
MATFSRLHLATQSLTKQQHQLTAFTEKRARESNGQSVWKEVYLSAGLATPVALMGASGQGKTALFELLRLNLASSGSASLHKDKQQPHGEVGVPTLDAQECLMSLSHSRRITLIDVPGTSTCSRGLSESPMCVCVCELTIGLSDRPREQGRQELLRGHRGQPLRRLGNLRSDQRGTHRTRHIQVRESELSRRALAAVANR